MDSSTGSIDTIIVITNRLSKNVIFKPMESTTAEAVAEHLLHALIRHYSLPTAIVSDHRPQFISIF